MSTATSSTSMAASQPRSEPLRVVVMGVTGCGKSTAAAAIAAGFGIDFIDGDSLHLPESIEKMSRAIPLADTDRWPWLERIAAALCEGRGMAVACSALKLAYREYLRARVPGLRFVFLDAAPALITARVSARKGHFMPAALVESQFAALERPDGEPGVVTVAADAQLDTILQTCREAFI